MVESVVGETGNFVSLGGTVSSDGTTSGTVVIKREAVAAANNRNMAAAIAIHAGGAETANHVTWTQGQKVSRIIVWIFPTTPGANIVGQEPVLLVADAADGDTAKAELAAAGGVSTDVEYYPLAFGVPNEIAFNVSTGTYLGRVDIDGYAVRCIIEAYQ